MSPAGCEAGLSWAIWTPSKVVELIRPLGYFGTKQPVHLEFRGVGEHSDRPPLAVLLIAAAPKPASGAPACGGGAG